MAEILTFRFTMLYDSGSFSDGDIIEAFWDDVAEDIVIRQNDIEIFTGPLLQNNGSDYVLQNFNYGFCDGTTLNQFKRISDYITPFPYVERTEFANSPSCTGSACDLIINSLDTLKDTGSGDGEITVNASSSAGGLKYSLSDFDYLTGGQVLPTFTGLSAGFYSVYVKDSFGCFTRKDVTIGSAPVYGLKYICEFDNYKNETRLEIHESRYEGESEEVCLADTFGIHYDGGSYDSFYLGVVQTSRLEFSLISDTDQKYLGMYTASHKRYRGIVKRDGVEVWRGYITPGAFSEPWQPGIYATFFTFVDGLQFLTRRKITSYDFDGSNSLIKYITSILDSIGLELPIHVSVNVYSEGMDTALSTLAQTYLQADGLERDDIDALKALEWVLGPFGCVLTQYAGAWWIVRHDQRGSEFTYYIFSEGVFTGTDTYNPVINLNCPAVSGRIVNINRDATLDVMPAFGEIVLEDNFSLKESLIYNHNFEILNPLSTSGFSGWVFVLDGSSEVYVEDFETSRGISAGIVSPLKDSINSRDAFLRSSSALVRYTKADKFRFRFQYSFSNYPDTVPFVILEIGIRMGVNYLQPDLKTWEPLPTTQLFRVYPKYAGGFGEYSFEFKGPDLGVVSSSDLQVRIQNANVFTPEYAAAFDISTIATTDLPVGYKIDKVHPTYNVRVQYYELIAGNDGGTLPSDYDAGTNDKSWKLVGEASIVGRTTPGETSIFYIDDVEIDYLPNGQDPLEEQVTPFVVDVDNPELLDIDLQVGGLPFNYALNTELTVNDIYQYNSNFTSIIGAFLNQWGRKDLDEAVRLQILYVNTILQQHRTQSFRITGSFTARELGLVSVPGVPIDVSPLDCVYDSYSNKYYIIVSYSAFDKDGFHRLELVELKSGAAQTPFGAFSGGFSDGFS